MVKLILEGGGTAQQSRTVDKFYVSLLPKSKRMLYIPIAMPPDSFTFSECHDWIRGTFRPLGLTAITMWTDLTKKSYTDLDQFDTIYIGGGNTFQLLKALQDTGFLKILEKFAKSDRVIYGGSAGAIIFGKTISTASIGDDADENKIGLKNLKALNLVDGLEIDCHYKSHFDSEMHSFVKEHKCKLVGIPEESAVYITGKKKKIIGTEPVYIFSDGKKSKFKPGSLLKV